MDWQRRWGYTIATESSAPGIWKLKTGGYLVVVRSRDRLHKGRRKTAQRALHDASLSDAKQEREQLRRGVRALAGGQTRERMRWSEFAASLFERKEATRELKSAKTIERWETTLIKHLIPALGDFWCDELRYADLEAWRTTIATRLAEPKRIPHPEPEKARLGKTARNPVHLAPATANGWISILKVIGGAMTAELELARDPTLGLKYFDTSTTPTYTEESPNALTPDQARLFLATMREIYPQHYPMTLLGFVTGLRPSSLRPLRRKGGDADFKKDEGVLLVRRSNSKGQSVMETTKTGKRQRIQLPQEVLEVLKEHTESFEDGPMRESDLLFPARHGGFRARSVLDKPFKDVSRRIGLPFEVTPRAMRRTNKDLMRAAQVPDVVSKAISGHATDAMHERYSTASAQEVGKAIGTVTKLVHGDRAGKKKRRARSKRAGGRAGRRRDDRA